MKEFSSELGQNYSTYTFGYTQYAQQEAGDTLSEIYTKGYLPYSGAPLTEKYFYRARSARVRLKDFILSSENRRIARKFDGQFSKESVPTSVYAEDETFYAFCLAYFETLHGPHAMPKARLRHILNCGLISSVTRYYNDTTTVAYVLEVADEHTGHYWFSFYDVSFIRQSLGLWLMLDKLCDAKKNGLTHYYLGTVYGEKALYKTNFPSLEWWNGSEWSTDIAQLKERGRTDTERTIPLTDQWKKGSGLFLSPTF